MRGLLIIILLVVIASIAITNLAPQYSPFPESVKRIFGVAPHIPGTSRVEASVGPPPEIDPDNPLHHDFEEAYRAKLSNAAYVEWKSRSAPLWFVVGG